MSLVSTTAGARPIKDVLLIGLGAVGAICEYIVVRNDYHGLTRYLFV